MLTQLRPLKLLHNTCLKGQAIRDSGDVYKFNFIITSFLRHYFGDNRGPLSRQYLTTITTHQKDEE